MLSWIVVAFLAGANVAVIAVVAFMSRENVRLEGAIHTATDGLERSHCTRSELDTQCSLAQDSLAQASERRVFEIEIARALTFEPRPTRCAFEKRSDPLQ